MPANKKWMKEFFPYIKDDSKFPNYFDKTIVTQKQKETKKSIDDYVTLQEFKNIYKEVWDT
jgi:hypothetical protein